VRLQSMARRVMAAGAALLCVGAGGAVVRPQPALADPGFTCTNVVVHRQAEHLDVTGGRLVLDQDRNADPNPDRAPAMLFHRGDKIEITEVTGEFWAGVLFTPPNGPRGWEGWRAPDRWPAPGDNQFARVGVWGDAQTGARTPFFVGDRTGCYEAPDRPSYLFLFVNDDVLTDNKGAFHVTMLVGRRFR